MSEEKIKRSEDEEQIAVCQWLTFLGVDFIHVPNEGKRSLATARKLKAMGMKKGFPDLFIFAVRGKYHGLAIEMKVEGGRPTREQRDWLNRLHRQGYAAGVCYGADEAIKAISRYLELKPGESK